MARRVATCGWLIALLLAPSVVVSVGAQTPEAALFRAEDPVGDVRPIGLTAGPGVAAIPYVDLTALEILGDDGEALLFSLYMADLDAAAEATPRYMLTFMVDRYQLELEITATFGQGLDWPASTNICLSGGQWTSCRGGTRAVGVTANIEADRIELLVPKELLGGRIDGNPVGPMAEGISPPQQGDTLSSWQVTTAIRGVGGFFTVYFGTTSLMGDAGPDAPEASTAYVVRTSAANARLALWSPIEQPTYFPTVDGRPAPWIPYGATIQVANTSAVPITLANRAPAKRLVEFDVQWEGDDVEGWQALLPEGLAIAAGQETQLSVAVTAPKDAAHRDRATLVVRAASLGHPDETAMVRVPVVASEVAASQWSLMRFHSWSRTDDRPECLAVASLCEAVVPSAWINPLPDDPSADSAEDGVAVRRVAFFATNDPTIVRLEMPFDVSPEQVVRMSSSQPLALAMSLASDPPFVARLEADFYTGDVLAGSATMDASLGRAPELFELPIIVNPLHSTMRPGDPAPRLVVRLVSDDPTAAGYDFSGVRWFVTDSALQLPVLEPVRPSRASPTIGLFAQGDAEDFVNPGETLLLPFLLVNQDQEPQTLTVTAVADDERWTAGVRPAYAYRIGPGESVNATLVLQAPSDATEGEVTVVHVAAGAPDQEAEASFDYRAIVTSGVDLADQADLYVADDDAAAKAVVLGSPEADAAFLSWPVVLLTLGIAAAYRRRVTR